MNQANTAQSNMPQPNIVQMSDIFLPFPTEELIPVWLLLVEISAGLICVVIIFYLLWKYFKTPLAILERRLKQGKLSPREAAHGLAHLLPMKNNNTIIETSLQQQIDRIRFQRQAPDINNLLTLINKVKHER